MVDFAGHYRQLADVAEAWFPQPTLAISGSAFLALVPVGIIWAMHDRRQVAGEPVALKPTRFALSIGIYMLTAAAMFNAIRPEHRTSALPQAGVWVMVVGSGFEFACILLQAARARRSHFNRETPLDAAIYALMGLFAVLFVGAVLPLAWEIASRPHPSLTPVMKHAIIVGLLATFVLGGGTGGLMSGKGAPNVGFQKGRVPLLGWSLAGGDIRMPHFFGIHAMQALPMMAAGALLVSSRRAELVSAMGSVAYVLFTVLLAGRSMAIGSVAPLFRAPKLATLG